MPPATPCPPNSTMNTAIAFVLIGIAVILLRLERLSKENKTMTQETQDALAAVTAGINKIGTDQVKLFADLETKIAAGSDTSDVVAALTGTATQLANIDAAVLAEDAKLNPVPPAA